MLGRQWELRLKDWKECLEKRIEEVYAELPAEYFTCFDMLPFSDAKKHEFKPLKPGDKWGKMWEYAWVHTSFTVPEDLSGKRITIHLKTAPEMLVYVNGSILGSIDKQHGYITLSPSAKTGEVFDIYAECFAGNGDRVEDCGPAAPGEITVRPDPGLQVTVGKSYIAIWNEAIYQTYMDYLALYEIMQELPEDSLRRMKIIEGLKKFTYIADFELSHDEMEESVVKAREVLTPLMECRNGSTAPLFGVFGQSHLDLMWMWHEDETRRKSARTYSNQLALMKEYPEFKFFLCCPTVLEYLKKYYPDVYGEVKMRAGEGRFIPDGAMWIECDTNIPSGESIIRQFVRGKRWFKKNFGADSLVAWMPDTFGFSGNLPQIMKKCGVSYFATQKLLRADPECEPFPYNVFNWEGIDGTKILSHIYKKNNSRLSPKHLIERWRDDRNQEENIDTMMFPFGFGDGGGGVTRDMLEQVRRLKDLEGAPKCEYMSPEEYFKNIEKNGTDNTYTGELYLAWHRGTYTTQGRTKRALRRAETALHDLEYFVARAYLSGLFDENPGKDMFQKVLDETKTLWDEVLFAGFHDIAAGTSIERVHKEVNERLDKVIGTAKELTGKVIGLFPASVDHIYNTTGFDREYNGVTVPAFGGVPMTESSHRKDLSAVEKDGEYHITTPDFSCIIDKAGRITSFKNNENKEFVGRPWNELLMYKDINGCYDAWEISSMYENTPVELDNSSVASVDATDKNCVITVKRKIHDSEITQEICISVYSPRIDFKTHINWNERHKLLKASFPCDITATEAMEEIPFGFVKRPTHTSKQSDKDRYEVSNRRYTCLSDGNRGVAVLNDGKYGVSVRGGDIRLTLLKSPLVPDMNADRGEHEFTYSVYPFTGCVSDSDLLKEATDLNNPFVKGAADITDSFISIDRSHIVIDGIFIDEETKETVIRLYEAMGMADDAKLFLPDSVSTAAETDMLLDNRKDLPISDNSVDLQFGAFEIKTVVIHR